MCQEGHKKYNQPYLTLAAVEEDGIQYGQLFGKKSLRSVLKKKPKTSSLKILLEDRRED